MLQTYSYVLVLVRLSLWISLLVSLLFVKAMRFPCYSVSHSTLQLRSNTYNDVCTVRAASVRMHYYSTDDYYVKWRRRTNVSGSDSDVRLLEVACRWETIEWDVWDNSWWLMNLKVVILVKPILLLVWLLNQLWSAIRW